MQLLRRDWDAHAPMPAMTADEWEHVVRRALHHGVAGLLCRGVLRDPAGIPDEIRDAAEIYLERALAEGDARRRQTIEALDTLEADAIPVLALKGVGLSVLAHGAPELRPGKDIDVLVHRDDMGRAVASLAKLGYRLGDALGPRITETCFDAYGQDIVFASGRLPVEPHWTFAPRTLHVDFDLDAIWSSAITIDLGGRTVGERAGRGRMVRTLSLEDTLLVACLHGAKEKWWRLLWVADVAALVHRHPELAWDTVIERASRAGILRIVHVGLGLARMLFSLALPVQIGDAIDRDTQCRRLIEESRQRVFADADGPEPLWRVSLFHWRARERLRDRLGYVARTLTTPEFKHYRMVALPDRLHFAYVPLKLVHDYVLLPLWNLGKGRLWRRLPAASADRR
ncbi:MAG TPA: nucleotidyltransferase family protein [Casimicrobiaceae bacterium]